ncbi:hypothetical protein BC831DRAFT_290795 [Entophlyctis helioformis]|nr:hypothetical protein BC831DRAFT_290795 [Entophlyctis helioformis]
MPSRYMPSMRPTPSRSVAVLALYILLWTASPSVQLPTRQIAPREVADAEPQVNVVPPPIAPPPSTRCKAEADTPPDDTTDVGPRQSKRAFDPLPDESTPNSCGHLQDNLCGLGARCLMDATAGRLRARRRGSVCPHALSRRRRRPRRRCRHPSCLIPTTRRP